MSDADNFQARVNHFNKTKEKEPARVEVTQAAINKGQTRRMIEDIKEQRRLERELQL